MTNKEIINRNIGLSFDFVKAACDDLSIIERIPNGAILEFVEKDFPRRESDTTKRVHPRKYIKVKNEFEVL